MKKASAIALLIIVYGLWGSTLYYHGIPEAEVSAFRLTTLLLIPSNFIARFLWAL